MQPILTQETSIKLLRSQMPSDKKWMDVPDTKLGTDQLAVIKAAQATFGVTEASTFCLGISDKGKKTIVQPKLVRKGNAVAIRWGKNSYDLTATKLDSVVVSGDNICATVQGYSIPLSFVDLRETPDRDVTVVQRRFRVCPDSGAKVNLISSLSLSQLAELLRVPGTSFIKLADLPQGSEHAIVGYEYSNGMYGAKYTLTLADGTKVDGNTAIKGICSQWDAMGVEVSAEKPANLIIGGRSKTKTDKTIVHIELYSYEDMSVEPFDFSDGEPVEVSSVTEDDYYSGDEGEIDLMSSDGTKTPF